MILTKSHINQLSYEIVGCAIEVHKQLGPGLLEVVYHQCMQYELMEKGFLVESEVAVPIHYKRMKLSNPLRLDLLVNSAIIVELKAVEILHPIYSAQLLSYMKLTQKPKGLLINFFSENITKSLVPLVNEYFNMLPD
ncbi:MAG: GxxExxY protein [Saprospiraceae bacterium]|nr:GxxExxY protein [Saprospiraceae bacterium]MCB9321103.1 GxxExxY protein [Lewinellaceae bacterium]